MGTGNRKDAVTETRQADANLPLEAAPLPGAFVYKLRDADRCVLYIGTTANLRQRMLAHARDKHWWPRVAHVSAAWYETREAALVSEAVEIRAVHPACNNMTPDPLCPSDGMLSLAAPRRFPSPAEVAAMGAVWVERDIAELLPAPVPEMPHITRTEVPTLAGLAEIAVLLAKKARKVKVSRTYAGQVAGRPDFPEPVDHLAMGPVWLEADVAKFIETPRAPGRKRKEEGKS